MYLYCTTIDNFTCAFLYLDVNENRVITMDYYAVTMEKQTLLWTINYNYYA